MANIDPAPSWAPIRQLETTDRNLAGPGGVLNTQPVSIAARLNLLRDNATALNNTVVGVSSRQDSADSAIASLEAQVLSAPGTLSDLENGTPLDPSAGFPDVPSVENSSGPVGAINSVSEALTARTKYLEETALTPEKVVDKAGTSVSGQYVASLWEAHGQPEMMALVKRNATFSLSNNNPSTPISWNDRRYDTSGIWSTGNPTRATVPAGASGFWNFRASIEFPATTTPTGVREVIIRRLGSTIMARVGVAANPGGRTQIVQVETGPVAAYQGHYFEVLYYQDSGVTLTGEFAQSSFHAERAGDFRGRWEGVVFSADYQYQAGWSKYQRGGGTVIEPSGLSIQPDPVNPAKLTGRIRCTRFNNSVQYPRVQAQTNSFITLTDDVYVGLSIFIPQDTHDRLVVAGHGINLHEIYGPPFGTKSPNIIQYNPVLGLNVNAFIDGQDVKVWQLPPEECVGKWVDIVHRVRMSTNPAVGFHEVWCDKGDGNFAVQQVLNNGTTRFNLATVLPDVNNGGNNFSSLKVSWAADSPLDEATVYFGEHRVGTDLYVRSDRSSFNSAY